MEGEGLGDLVMCVDREGRGGGAVPNKNLEALPVKIYDWIFL